MSDCAACEYLSFTVNWQYLARHLGKMRQSSDTGLNEVSELYYGQCVEIGRNLQRRMHRYWNPVDVARARRIQCARDAESFVRHTVKVCVHAWAACQKSVVLRLSGGLDSSILLSCLHDAPTRPHVVCINRYSRRSDSDEREFARLAAQSKGCELIELYRDPNFSFEKIFSSRPAERPYNYILQYSQILPEAELADARGAGAIFDGVFGDDLFFGGGYQLAAADYVHDFGLRPSLLPVIVSAARVSRLSVWKVLRVALSKGLFRQQWDPIQVAREFNLLMDEDVLRKLVGSVSETHPWYQKNRYVPPGKQSQIAGIMDRNVYDMPFADFDNVRHVSPLLSQPIAELCLQIPTYVLSRNGWDREVQRQAFSPDIPEKIARRRTKAGQEDFSAEVKRKNHALIRDVLMNGWLVESGLVDRAKLEAAFAGRSAGLDRGPARMSRLINIEVWLKTWMDNKLRVAA
jgi:asparagine synthase (glutamine-hydrolysing)